MAFTTEEVFDMMMVTVMMIMIMMIMIYFMQISEFAVRVMQQFEQLKRNLLVLRLSDVIFARYMSTSKSKLTKTL